MTLTDNVLTPRRVFNTTLALCSATALATLELPGNTLFLNALQNAGHSLVFFCLGMLMFVPKRTSTRLRVDRFLSIGCGLFLLGVIVEITQEMSGRGADMGDLVQNTGGILSAAGVSALVWPHRYGLSNRPRRRLLLMATIATAVACLWQPLAFGYIGLTGPRLPLIADFEHRAAHLKLSALDSRLLIERDSEAWPNNASRVLNARFSPGPWPSIRLLEPGTDWTAYDALVLRVFNPATQAKRLYIRIDDILPGQTSSYRMTVDRYLPGGVSELRIPLEHFAADARRRSGITAGFMNVQAVLIFLYQNPATNWLLFDDIRLE